MKSDYPVQNPYKQAHVCNARSLIKRRDGAEGEKRDERVY